MTEKEYEETFYEYLENAAEVRGSLFSNAVYMFFCIGSMYYYKNRTVGVSSENTADILRSSYYYDECITAAKGCLDLNEDEIDEAYDLACRMVASLLIV